MITSCMFALPAVWVLQLLMFSLHLGFILELLLLRVTQLAPFLAQHATDVSGKPIKAHNYIIINNE